MLVTKVAIPINEPILHALKRTDYADAFHCRFQCKRSISIEEVVYAFFDSAPSWIGSLFTVRDQVVKLFGLKTITAKERVAMRQRFKVEEGEVIGLFKILKKEHNTVLLGDDDKHLSFRVLIQLSQIFPDQYEVKMITTVMLHNKLGRLYFAIIKPFHLLVVKAMLKNTVRHLVHAR